MSEALDRIGLARLLMEKCREAGSQAAWARTAGISPTVVSDTLNVRDDRNPSPAIVAALGLRAVTRYVPVKPREPTPPRPRLPPSARLEPRDPKLFSNG